MAIVLALRTSTSIVNLTVLGGYAQFVGIATLSQKRRLVIPGHECLFFSFTNRLCTPESLSQFVCAIYPRTTRTVGGLQSTIEVSP